MTLDEAIKHCEEVAEANDQGLYDAIALGGQNPTQEEITACEQCAADHRQLAEWLTELKERRAADVQPVKRGKWIHFNDNGFIFCSECHKEAYWDTDYGQQLFDYCPYCGAMMLTKG